MLLSIVRLATNEQQSPTLANITRGRNKKKKKINEIILLFNKYLNNNVIYLNFVILIVSDF